MINNQTLENLKSLRLSSMAKAFKEQMEEPQNYTGLSFEERIAIIVDAECMNRKNNLLGRLIRHANFNQPQASIEDITYLDTRLLDKELISRLATNKYIRDTKNIILIGASGTGKTYLSCALGMSACRSFIKTKYIRLPDLLVELAIARDNGNFKKIIEQYKKVTLLIIDEWLLISLKETEARDLLEIVEARNNRASTIFCSQFIIGGWHEKIGEATIADAILDRIVHNSYHINIKSEESMRKLQNSDL